tara:strand:+ start:441 stop:1118 length:678 start_codon:yes stop_codon:yes gene_type:complete
MLFNKKINLDNKIIVMDLDDTIYDENSFFNNGLDQVSRYLSKYLNKSYKGIYNDLLLINLEYDRDKIFNRYLDFNIKNKKKLISNCIQIYRYNNKIISPYPDAQKFLNLYKGKLFLVTDGNKKVQSHKVNLLKIKKYFKKIYITRRFGIRYEKPSLYCFKKILKTENSSWENLCYIGDNPNKDFINLNKSGSITVRMLRGKYKKLKLNKLYDAKIKVYNFNQFLN